MCGITGVVYRDPTTIVPPPALAAMCHAIAYRGPDDHGVYTAPGVGLGHQRLSILDPAHGHQPMEYGGARIVYNGEIYNHLDLRPALKGRGEFRTHCDTETILHLLDAFGDQSIGQLNGMFALALWRESSRTLLLARDRMGVKPLYYAETPDGSLVFGSEIKALFAGGLLAPEIDESAIAEYLAFGHVSGTRTLYRGVRKLTPGTMLTWRDGRSSIKAFADNAIAGDLPPVPRTLDEAADTFWMLFRKSVSRQLLSDVPLGIFLSGGLDSSLILAAMKDAGVQRPLSFAVGYREAPESELGHAARVAALLGSEHHECSVSEQQFFDVLPGLTWHRDLPVTFAASIPLYFVSQLAVQQVKVVLTGEGSDELFAGYGRYPRALWNRRVGRLLDSAVPHAARGAARRALGRGRESRLIDRLFRSGLVRRATLEDSYVDVFAAIDDQHLRRVMRRMPQHSVAGVQAQLGEPDLWSTAPLEALLRLDIATYLEELLMKQDTMSMATSLESRVPFLDNDLVAWAYRVPARFKLSQTRGKLLVRRAAARWLPRDVINAKKRGFPVPLGTWFRRGAGLAMLRDIGVDDQDPYLNPEVVEGLIAEHGDGRDHTDRLWRILAFQTWRRDVVPRMAPRRA